jgi:hypothetical protein
VEPDARGLRVTETLFKDYDTERNGRRHRRVQWRPSDQTAWVRGTYARFEDDEFRDRIGILWSEGTLQADRPTARRTGATPASKSRSATANK